MLKRGKALMVLFYAFVRKIVCRVIFFFSTCSINLYYEIYELEHYYGLKYYRIIIQEKARKSSDSNHGNIQKRRNTEQYGTNLGYE